MSESAVPPSCRWPRASPLIGSPPTECSNRESPIRSTAVSTGIRPKGWRACWPISRVVRCGGVFDRRAELIERLRRGPVPAAAGKPAATRWTLARVAAALPWLAGYSLSGVWKLLRGSGIRLRSARVQAYSPDPDYEQKVEHLCAVLREASHARRSSAWWCSWTKWATAAFRKPRAIECLRPPHQCGWQSALEVDERKWRLMGALNAQTGRVDTLDNYIVGRKQVIQFLGRLNA